MLSLCLHSDVRLEFDTSVQHFEATQCSLINTNHCQNKGCQICELYLCSALLSVLGEALIPPLRN